MVACSGDAEPPAAPETLTPPPSLATNSLAKGEVLFRGRFAPRSHGPVGLRGRYLVRFEQWAPEDRARDFAPETAFVAGLVSQSGSDRGRRIPLFRAAAARGRRRVELSGRYLVDIAFGDFPYVVRFTPRG